MQNIVFLQFPVCNNFLYIDTMRESFLGNVGNR